MKGTFSQQPALKTAFSSKALQNALDAPLAARPRLHYARDALALARLQRLRFDASSEALQAKLKLATQELASEARGYCNEELSKSDLWVVHQAALSASKLEGEQIDKLGAQCQRVLFGLSMFKPRESAEIFVFLATYLIGAIYPCGAHSKFK